MAAFDPEANNGLSLTQKLTDSFKYSAGGFVNMKFAAVSEGAASVFGTV
ncbi:hypothetical protein TGPRC2_425990 [Toxoplasma gondii TgCatPRC2]|uniref:Uncharacterized protein n=1 Tax=Toxoplasma gondii TgCatPRC2 TaxID=1130821 RepID=A0A151H7F1_TOXGO|nr:hypothetical protein TGPRC2_425990 [Toxoplasma gondii TgCatPRC2]